MFMHLVARATAGIAGLVLATAVNAAPSVWFCEELYSNADGSVQFIMFSTDMPGQQFLSGQSIAASNGVTSHSYTFPHDLPGDSANRRFLVATQGFVDLHALSPDYVVPNGFLFLPGGSINCIGNPYNGHMEASYAALPTDGVNAWFPACDFETLGPPCVMRAEARNFAGHSYTFPPSPVPPSPSPSPPPPPPPPPPVVLPPSDTPTPSVPVIEFYHAGFDHYFITADPDEIAKLDRGIFAGWARTGLSFEAYLAPVSGTSPVCRFFTVAFAPKSSHFLTPFASECAVAERNPQWIRESGDAFNIGVPNPDGSCGGHRMPVYRLYNNGQGGAPNHRYTTDVAVRTQMIAEGWVPEGYGADGVNMCSPP